MDNFTMSEKYSCKCLKRQTKPWKHKCYRYLLGLTFCTMSYKITNKKFIWFQRYKEITRRLSPKWNQKNIPLLFDTLFIYRKKFLAFHFILMHLKLYKLYKDFTQTLMPTKKASLSQVFPFKSQGVFTCLI